MIVIVKPFLIFSITSDLTSCGQMMSAAAAGQYYRSSAAAAAQMRSVYNPAGLQLFCLFIFIISLP